MKLHSVVILLFLTSLVSGQTQNDVNVLNQYKYVYLSSGNVPPFMRVSLYDDVTERLKECGLKVIRKKEKQQISDTCAIVYCVIQDFPEFNTVRGNTNTCIRLSFTDCNRQQVFISKTGFSDVWLKGTKWGYEIATSEALQSLDNYHYAYSTR